uniref:BPI2 domain-containing protein n=1 Tax=Rhabditophanes sp. KR3021 TaxID=114890 RepID=A0AC35TGL4_9BILA
MCNLIKLLVLLVGTSSLVTSNPVALTVLKPQWEHVNIVANGNETSGIFFRISQKGVDYLTDLVEEAIPMLMERIHLPDFTVKIVSATENIIKTFDRPTIKTNFMNGKGVSVNLGLPKVFIMGDLVADLMIAVYKASYTLNITNLVIDMDVDIKREVNNSKTFVNVTKCAMTQNYANIVFYGEDGENINGIKNEIISTLEEQISTHICGLTYMLKGFLEAVVEESHKKRDRVDDSLVKKEPRFEEFLCSNKIYNEEEEGESDVEEEAHHNSTSNINISDWGIDLSLKYPITVSDKDLLFGIDAGALYLGESAQNVSKPQELNINILKDQMIGFIITEYVPNTFFDHIHKNGIGIISKELNENDAPKYLKKIIRAFCSTCKVLIKANLTDPIVTKITKNGIQVNVSGDFGVYFDRNAAQTNLISGDLTFETTLRPHIRHSRIFGDLALTAVDINFSKIGMNGLLANPLRKAVNFIIPKMFWPLLKKRLRFAIERKGIKLPTMCGVEFEKLHIEHQQHATVISSDLSIDIHHMVKAFKMFMEEKVQKKILQNEDLKGILRYY